jgi:hypothetical protein
MSCQNQQRCSGKCCENMQATPANSDEQEKGSLRGWLSGLVFGLRTKPLDNIPAYVVADQIEAGLREFKS